MKKQEMPNSNVEEFLHKNRNRAKRRHNSIKKAIRKRNIQKNTKSREWYNNLHQYSKNKIHCSCWMCSFQGDSASYLKADARHAYDMSEYEKTL